MVNNILFKAHLHCITIVNRQTYISYEHFTEPSVQQYNNCKTKQLKKTFYIHRAKESHLSSGTQYITQGLFLHNPSAVTEIPCGVGMLRGRRRKGGIYTIVDDKSKKPDGVTATTATAKGISRNIYCGEP